MRFSEIKTSIDYYVIKDGLYGCKLSGALRFSIGRWSKHKGDAMPFPRDAAERLKSEHQADSLEPCEVQTCGMI